MSVNSVMNLSENYKEAQLDPWPKCISQKFRDETFKDVPELDREQVIRDNGYAILGREVAMALSDMPAFEIGSKRSYEEVGTYVNLIGQLVNSVLLKDIPEAASYRERVEQAAEYAFGLAQEGGANLQHKNFSSILNLIDVPDGKWGKGISLKIDDVAISKIKNLFSKHFNVQVVKRNEHRDATSLRAMLDRPEEIKAIIKELVDKSGFLSSEGLVWGDDIFSVMVEGKDVSNWVKEHAKTYSFTEEQLSGIENKTAGALYEKASNILFNGVVERMKSYAKEHPVMALSPKDLVLFLIQDFYLCLAGIKQTVDAGPINQVRDEICPGIKEAQYPRVTYSRLFMSKMNPFEKKMDTVAQVLQELYKETKEDSLAWALVHLNAHRSINSKK